MCIGHSDLFFSREELTFSLGPVLTVLWNKYISDELLAERENNKRIAHQMDLKYADIAGY